jgi:hypothetical protein
MGKQIDGTWEHFAWSVKIGSEVFEYKTGLGHAKKPKKWNGITYGEPIPLKPKIRHVLHAIASDAQCAQDTFEDFCSNLGYDTDSRRALDTYLKCQDNGHKLRKALKSRNAIERINKWEL